MIAELVKTFETTVKFIEQSVSDLAEEQMVEQPPGVPNHAQWTLGHIIFSCQGIAAELGAEPWLPDDWESAFGYGSTPSAGLSRYPNKAEMLTILAESAGRLRHTLVSSTESSLKEPLPDEAMPTVAHLLLQVVLAHTAFHAGQLAMWRRAIGKPSVAVFV
jgi:hypothetical protein